MNRQERKNNTISLWLLNLGDVAALLAVAAPLLWNSRYNVPSADDWSYGREAYQALRDGGNFFSVLKTSMSTVARHYMGWEGRFVNSFLASLQPGIWGEHCYKIVGWLMIGSLIFGELFAFRTLLVGREKSGRLLWLPVAIPTLMLQILYTPSTVESFYWYTGAVNYTFIFALDLVFLALFKDLANGVNMGWKRGIQAAAAVVLAVMVGGDNYATGLATFLGMLLFYVWVLCFARQDVKGYKTERASGHEAERASVCEPAEVSRQRFEEAAGRKPEEAAGRKPEEAAGRKSEVAAGRRPEEAAGRKSEAARRRPEEAAGRRPEAAARRKSEAAAGRESNGIARHLAWNAAGMKTVVLRTWYLVVLEGGCMIACILAPGNQSRIQDNFGGGMMNGPVDAVLQSLWRTLTNGYSWMNGKLAVMLLLMVPFLWELAKKMDYDFAWPGMFTLFSYGVYASEMTANLYVDGTTGGGRAAAVLYYSFHVWLVLNLFFWIGYLEKRCGKISGVAEILGQYKLLYCGVLGVVMAALLFTGDLRELSSYRAYRDWRQGWAGQYAAEWDARYEVLHDDNVDEVVFAPLSVWPETILYTDLQDEDGYVWVNKACARYYGKSSVIVR